MAAAEARPLRAPLLGVELTPPPGFRVATATPTRMEFASAGSAWQLTLFVVEFGNRHPQGVRELLLRELAAGGKVSEAPARLAGRPARWLRWTGLRQKQKWSGCALWSEHAGQAWVLEALGPNRAGLTAEPALRKLAASWKWLQPERG